MPPTPLDPIVDPRRDPSTSGIGRTFVRGIAWTALVKWGSQVLSWGAVVVLARILTPADYGLVGLATLYLGFVATLTEGGLGSTIVAMRQMTVDEVAQFNSVALLMGLVGAVVTCAAAVPLAWFFQSPELRLVVVALSLNALLSALRLVPVAVLGRELRYRGLALVDGLQAITTTLVTLGLAWAGSRYWALVWGGIAGNVMAVVVSRVLAPQSFSRPTRAGLGRYVHFTRDVLVGRISWFIYTNADFVVAGRMLGTTALGWYSFAWNIASTPVEKVTALVTRITPGIFSRLQEDIPELRRLVLNVTEGLVYLTLPAAVGMAIVADDFVRAYLGDQYLGAIAPLRILALYATFRSIVTLLPQALTVLGHTRFLMINGLITVTVLPIAFVAGSRWGAAGIAAMWMIVYPLHVLPLFRRSFAALDLSLGAYLSALWPAIRGAALMAVAIFILRALVPDLEPVGRLALQAVVGAAVFAVVAVYPQRHRLAQLRALLGTQPSS